MKFKIVDTELASIMIKLLARENLVVSLEDVSTAYFLPQERKVILPLKYINLNKDLLNLFASHEVSHALNTPDCFQDAVKEFGFDPAMVFEDSRIENLIKDEFPGLINIFRSGYTILLDQDFFGIGKGITQVTIKNNPSFLDRLNIKAKCRDLINVEFLPDEQDLTNRILNVRDYDEMISLLGEYKEIRKNTSKNNSSFKEEEDDNKNQSSSFDDVQGLDPNGASSSHDGIDEEDSDDDGLEQTVNSNDTNDEDYDGLEQTVNSNDIDEEDDDYDGLEQTTSSGKDSDNIDEEDDDDTLTHGLLEKEDFGADLEDPLSFDPSEGNTDDSRWMNQTKSGTVYSIPSIEEVEKRVIHWNEISDARERALNLIKNGGGNKKENDLLENLLPVKRSIQKNAMIMAMEFEQKKSAHRNSRAKISDTGILSHKRLVHYRYSDDLFKKVTTLPDGKNHGIILFVDYSGSMDNIASSMFRQLLSFTEFCRKVQIPFDVYAFSNNPQIAETIDDDDDDEEDYWTGLRDSSENVFQLNILSSRMTNKEYKKAFGQLLYYATSFIHAPKSKYESFYGTPLYETVVDSFALTDKFIQSNPNVEKISTLYLTDGEGHVLSNVDNVLKYKNKMMVRNTYNSYDVPEFLRIAYESYFDIKMSNLFLSKHAWFIDMTPEEVNHFDRNGILVVNVKKTSKTESIDNINKSRRMRGLNGWSSKLFVNPGSKSIKKSTSFRSSGDDLDELQDSFVAGGLSARKNQAIFRGLASFVS